MTFPWRQVCNPVTGRGKPKENVTESCIDNSRAQYRTRKHSKEEFRGKTCWTSLNPAGTSLYHSSSDPKLPEGNRAMGYGALVALSWGAEWGAWDHVRPCCGTGLWGWPGAQFAPPWEHTAGLSSFLSCFCCPTCKERSFGGDLRLAVAGLTQLSFSEKMCILLYCWPLRELIWDIGV